MILVTGSTGFVGRRIVGELCARGEAVRCLARTSSDVGVLRGFDVEICYGDVGDQSSLERAAQGVDTVIHLVAIIRERGRATFQRVNYGGTGNLVQAARRAGVERIIYMSNLGAGPDRRFPFLCSKWQGEEEVRNSGIDHIIFRPSVMFGEGDGFVTLLADIVRRSPVVPVIGSGRTRFQLIAVGDVATCVARAVEGGLAVNQTVPLGGPEYLVYEEIIDIVMQKLGARRLKVHIPIPLMRPVVWAMDRLLLKPPLTPGQLAMLNQDNVTDLDAVERVFGFRPASLREGIGSVLAWRGNRGERQR